MTTIGSLRGISELPSTTTLVANNWREVKTLVPEVKASQPSAKQNWRSYARRASQIERLRAIGISRLQTVTVDESSGLENPETKGLKLSLPHFLNWLKSATYILNICAREPECAKKVQWFLQNNLIGQFSKLDPVVAFFDIPSNVYGFPKVKYIAIERANALVKHRECYFSKVAYSWLKTSEKRLHTKADVDKLVKAAAQSGIPWEYTLEGCQLRAQILAEALEFMGVDRNKIRLQYHIGKDLLNGWTYHVAVAAITAENELLILDPSLDDCHSMSVEQWVTKCNGLMVSENCYLTMPQEIDPSKVSTFCTSMRYVLEYDNGWMLIKASESGFEVRGKYLRVSVEAAGVIRNLKGFSHLVDMAQEFNIHPFELSLPASWVTLDVWRRQSLEKDRYEPLMLTKEEIASLKYTSGMSELSFSLDEAISKLESALDYCQKSIEVLEVPEYALGLVRELTVKSFREKSEALSNKISEFRARQIEE